MICRRLPSAVIVRFFIVVVRSIVVAVPVVVPRRPLPFATLGMFKYKFV